MKKGTKNRIGKYLLLSWKRFFLIIISWMVAVVLHNLWYALFDFEEAVFFIIAVIVLPLILIVSAFYTIAKTFLNKIGQFKIG